MQNSLSETAVSTSESATSRDTAWRKVVPKYQEPNVRRAINQAVTTLGLLAVALYAMNRSLALPYWITVLLAVPTAGLFVRTFIIMHDCSHGSFLPWRR